MKNTILLATLLLSSSCAFAGNTYVGINAGSASQKVHADGESVSDNTTAFKVYGGYKMGTNVGIEAGYARFGKLSETEDGVTFGVKPTSFYVAVTGSMPATEKLDVFVKLGVARSETEIFISQGTQRASVDRNRSNVMGGIGLQYRFSDSFSAVAEYEHFGKVASYDEFGAKLKVSLVSVGLRMAF